MKKYIVIAIAALVAFAACTKVNPEEKKSEKISFTVANYMPQTKATSSLESEITAGKFICHAWYFPVTGDPMAYMPGVEVTKKTNPAEWSPANDYYWPKTGYINFYSYAGTPTPQVTATNGSKTVTMQFEDKTITATDNILVADPALHFTVAEYNADEVKINHEQGAFNYTGTNAGQYTYTTSSQSYTGVPTLFRHMLAKVAFVVKLKTNSAASSNTIWTVKVLNDARKSNIEARKTGTLTLKHTENATGATTGTWTVDAVAEDHAAIGWVPADATEVMPFQEVTLTLPVNTTECDPQTILPIRTVLPQETSLVALNLAYEISAKHTGDSDPFMTEVLTVSKQLSAAASTITAWNMNQITLYTITIDPVGKKITFDPAVVEWDSQSAEIAL